MKKMGLLAAVLFGFTIAAHALNVTPGSGGTAISADTAMNGGTPAWTTIGPITLSESKNGHRSHFRAGTNVTVGLQAPAGFQFNTAVIPNVEFTADRDITAASAAFTRSNLLTVTFTVSGTGNRDALMIGTTAGLQVQPISSAPLVSGNIYRPKGADGGSAVIKGVTPTSNLNGTGGGATSFGRLVEVAGSPTQLGILVQPSQNAVAGVPFGRQPVVAIQDAAGNVRTNINDMTVVAIRSDGVGNLLGEVAMPTVNGTATFTNLAADAASTINITFMAGDLQAVTSSFINVAPAPEPPIATSLGIRIQPSSQNVAGALFTQQPQVVVLDQYDLPFTNTAGIVVSAVRQTGSGELQGTTNVEAVDGVATFANLSHNVAGDLTVEFTAGSLRSIVSGLITIQPAIADRLVFETQPGAAVFGVPFGIQPAVITSDAYGNFSTVGLGDSVPMQIALLVGTGTLSGTVDADLGVAEENGVSIFNDLAIDLAGDKQLIATATGLASATSAVFTVASATQTIDFGPLAEKTFGDAPFTVSATASSGLPVAFSIVSGPATLSNDLVTIVGAGTITIRASQSGNDNFSAAPEVDQSFNVHKADQIITFGPLSDKVIGDDSFGLVATANSGLPVSFNIVSGPATITNNVVTLTGVGTVIVRAAQGGDENYKAAADVEQSFVVGKADQLISFGALSDKTFGDNAFPVTATASSGLPVSFSIVSGPATVSDDQISINGVGVVVVRASQSGNENYNAAADVEQSFTVAKSGQTISFGPLDSKTFGDSPFAVSATASSGLPVSFSIVSGPAVLVTPDTISINGAGTIVVRASQSGNENYSAAEQDQSFAVNKANQTITFDSLPGKQFGETPFEITAAASSGLPVSFSIVSGPATISENIVTLTGAGEVTIRASQAGNENYNAATDVDQVLAVGAPSDVRVKSDLNGDLKADVFFQSGTRVTVWQMNGLQFDRAVTVNKAYGTTDWKAFGQADFNKDGKQDIAWQHADGRLAVWYMDGRQRNGIGSIRPIAPEWKAVAVCDMNNDGSADLVFQNATGAVVIRYLNGLKISGNKRVTRADAAQWRVCGAGDIDLDSSADLIVQHTEGQVALWKGTGYKQTASINGGKATDWSVCGIGDMNQDDKFDIVLRSADGRLGVWTMNGAEKLPGRTVLRNGRRVLSASVAGPR